MSSQSFFDKRWSLTFQFPPRCDRGAVKQWARQVCLREGKSFDNVVAKLTNPQHSRQYQGVVVSVEEVLEGDKRRAWSHNSPAQACFHVWSCTPKCPDPAGSSAISEQSVTWIKV
eukprot:1151403-Pelagomonas_calceolata.AAC.2